VHRESAARQKLDGCEQIRINDLLVGPPRLLRNRRLRTTLQC